MKRILLSAFIILSCISTFAQFNLSAEYRPRFEFRDSYKLLPPVLGQTPAFMVSQRTRLNVGFKWSIINTYLSLQDVRIWGDEAMKKDVAGLGLYQGWAEIKVCDSFFVKAGRQEFVYDNERLLSNTNWQQKGLTHDALLLKYNHQGLFVDLGAAYNQSRDTTNSTDYNSALANYKSLSFLWLKYNIKKHFAVQAAFLADGYQKKNTTNTMYMRATTGAVFSYKSKWVDSYARGFYQWGQDETGAHINAYYANVDVTAKPLKWLTLIAGCEYMSGNDLSDTLTKNNNAFSTLYSSGHKFNGNIDFFTKPTDTKNTGLVDIYLNFIFTIKKQYQIRADFHYFSTQNHYTFSKVVQDAYLGSEADISAKIPIIKDVDVQVGYSALVGSPTLIKMQGNNKKNFSHWAFVMLTIKPTIFTAALEKK
jgi:hypothetical protein